VRNVNPTETYVTSTSRVVVEEFSPRSGSPFIDTNADKDSSVAPHKNNSKKSTTEETHKYDPVSNVLFM